MKHDWFDWLGLIGSLVVAPVVALLAAGYGAKVGGAEARAAALEVHEREAAEAKRLREEQRAARRGRMRALVERVLRRVVTLADGLVEGSSLQELSKCGAELRILSERFERASGDLHMVGAPEFESRVESFVAGLHSMVSGVEAALGEQSQMRQAEVAGAERSGRGIGNILTQYDPGRLLEGFRTAVKEKGQNAATLLDELTRVRAV